MGDGIPMDEIRNLSVRKTILLYMAVALICSFVFSAMIVRIAVRVQQSIWWNYVDEEAYYKARESEGDNYRAYIPRPYGDEMSQSDYFMSELCDFLQTYSILVVSMAGSCAAVWLFYKNKLKRPIEELEQASKMIAKNHLDFHITYDNKDEMGVLCMEFERMRGQLVRNNRTLWRTIEEEKILRAAIAHDLRSPLSVLKGYQEMLMEYLPSEEIDKEQAVEMLSECGHQIERMDTFVETMRKLNSLESRRMISGEISMGQLETEIQAMLAVLEKEYGRQYILQVSESEKGFCGDLEIILEVAENLMSNAFRYGKQQVVIMVKTGYLELQICVRDDGEGFREEAEKITEAFHGKNMKDSLKHAGIGMYISRLYCEKHGGRLILENDEQGGAVVTAIFGRIA